MADSSLQSDCIPAMLSALHDQVLSWERMLRGASSILETVLAQEMLASLPADEFRRKVAARAYEVLDFTSHQVAEFISQHDKAGNLPSEQLQDLEAVLNQAGQASD